MVGRGDVARHLLFRHNDGRAAVIASVDGDGWTVVGLGQRRIVRHSASAFLADRCGFPVFFLRHGAVRSSSFNVPLFPNISGKKWQFPRLRQIGMPRREPCAKMADGGSTA